MQFYSWVAKFGANQGYVERGQRRELPWLNGDNPFWFRMFHKGTKISFLKNTWNIKVKPFSIPFSYSNSLEAGKLIETLKKWHFLYERILIYVAFLQGRIWRGCWGELTPGAVSPREFSRRGRHPPLKNDIFPIIRTFLTIKSKFTP